MTSELILQDSELIIQDSELILQDSELILHDSELIWYSRIVSWYSNIVSWYSRILSWYSRILSWYSKLNIGTCCMYSVLDCCLLCLFAFYNSYMYSKIELCSCSSEVSSERKSFDRYGFWSIGLRPLQTLGLPSTSIFTFSLGIGHSFISVCSLNFDIHFVLIILLFLHYTIYCTSVHGHWSMSIQTVLWVTISLSYTVVGNVVS